MTNVIDFEGAAFWAKFRDRLGFDIGRTIVSYGEVTRHMESGVPTPNDPVTFGPTARDRFSALFTQYGFPMPTTWAELRANHEYIGAVEGNVDLFKIELHHRPKNPQKAFDMNRGYFSRNGLLEPTSIACAEGYERLAEFHVSNEIFKKNAMAYDESTDLLARELMSPTPRKPMEFVPWPDEKPKRRQRKRPQQGVPLTLVSKPDNAG